MPEQSRGSGRPSRLTLVFAALLAAWTVQAATAGEARIAVAANFADPAREIAELFQRSTGHEAILSFGSTGQLYAQIVQGAPFDAYLAADQARPKRVIAEGHAVTGSRFTYARGRLVLYSRESALVDGPSTLREARFHRLAVANPVTAPYGAAAMEVMARLGVRDRLSDRLVRGGNIAQTYQFVATGNAELGFVALSQVARHDKGSRWLVPGELHTPIAQDAVLLKRGAENAAARAFLQLLRGPDGTAVAERYGYGG